MPPILFQLQEINKLSQISLVQYLFLKHDIYHIHNNSYYNIYSEYIFNLFILATFSSHLMKSEILIVILLNKEVR